MSGESLEKNRSADRSNRESANCVSMFLERNVSKAASARRKIEIQTFPESKCFKNMLATSPPVHAESSSLIFSRSHFPFGRRAWLKFEVQWNSAKWSGCI